MYEKKYQIGILKMLIICNYLFCQLYIIKSYKDEHENEFEKFNKNTNIGEPEKNIINKDIIEYIIKKDNKEYKYTLTHDINNYIKKKNKKTYYYKFISEIFLYINILNWIVDVMRIV